MSVSAMNRNIMDAWSVHYRPE